ncbi:hypothetical protein Tco_0427569 [Tanacetum coccineum]
MPPRRTTAATRAAAATVVAAASMTVADVGTDRSKKLNEFPRHLLIMKLFETTLMVMAIEATILARESEELHALRRNKVKFDNCISLEMRYNGENSRIEGLVTLMLTYRYATGRHYRRG